MKQNKVLKQMMPHLVVLGIFLALTVAYFYPAFQGYSLKQGDISSYIGMAKEHFDYREATGDEALWTNSMFGGMPTYQIGLIHKSNVLRYVDKVFRFGLPHGVNQAFYYFIGFYILLLCMRVNPWLALAGSAAFAYSSYFYIILEAGHMSKAHAIALMGPVLGGAMLVYRGKYLFGGTLFAFFMGLQLLANHYQIAYYLGFVLLAFGLYQFVEHLRNKDLKAFGKKTAIVLLGAALAVGANSGRMFTTMEYAKKTIRGKSELSAAVIGERKASSTGLPADYITQWSYGTGETYSLLVPHVKGGASGALLYDDVVTSMNGKGKKKKAAKARLKEVDKELRDYVIQGLQQGKPVSTYWGAQPFTSGPVYLGAVVLLFFIVGLYAWKSKLKWYFLALIVLSVLLSWGKNYMPLTQFFIDNVPFYNKLRAVSTLLVIVEFLVPIIAICGINDLLKEPQNQKNSQVVFAAAASLLGIVLLVMMMPGSFFNFLSPQEVMQYSIPAMADIKDALVDYRIGLFQKDSLRSALFIALAAGAYWAVATNKLKQQQFFIALAVLVVTDLWTVNTRYLNNDKRGKEYVSWLKKEDKFKPFQASAADISIQEREFQKQPQLNTEASEAIKSLKKKGLKKSKKNKEAAIFATLNLNTNYRVFKPGRNAFQESETSYFHKSIGGYHAAKLKRYQELVDYAIDYETRELYNGFSAGNSSVLSQLNVLNMLNMKYVIFDPNRPAVENPYANGNGWFVQGIKEVDNADEELLYLLNQAFNSKKEVVSQKQHLAEVEVPNVLDSGTVVMNSYSPNEILYKVNSVKGGLVAFSEIYYEDGWNAYIDGELVPHFRSNFVLRTLPVPAGEHEVLFAFEPVSYSSTKGISLLCSSLIVALFAFASYKSFKQSGEAEQELDA